METHGRRGYGMKKLFENKRAGFYVTLAVIVLSVILAAVYAKMYAGSQYMSWPAFWCTLGGAVLALALGFTKLAKWSNVVVALGDFLGLLFYIYGIYFYVSVVYAGIQAGSFNTQFIVCTVGFVLLLVINLVNVFLKQVKEEE